MTQYTENFMAAERIVLDLHRLIASGQDGSEPANNLRDAGTDLLEKLTEREVEDIQRLSAELQMLYGSEAGRKPQKPQKIKHPPQRSKKQANHAPRPELVEALKREDWLGLLNAVRVEPLLEPWARAYIRGRAYSSLNRHRVAATFFEFAMSASPRVPEIQILFLNELVLAGMLEEALWRANLILSSKTDVLELQLMAANILSAWAQSDPERRFGEVAPRIIQVVEEISQLVRKGKRRIHPFMMAVGFAALGATYERAKDYSNVQKTYTTAINFGSETELFYTGRGIAHLRMGQVDAGRSDFQKVIKRRSPFIWAYAFEAHILIEQIARSKDVQRNSETCLDICEHGLKAHGPDTLRSMLSEWKAICLAQLNRGDRDVLAAFDHALHLNPSNEYCRENRALYVRRHQLAQESQAAESTGHWKIHQDQPLDREAISWFTGFTTNRQEALNAITTKFDKRAA